MIVIGGACVNLSHQGKPSHVALISTDPIFSGATAVDAIAFNPPNGLNWEARPMYHGNPRELPIRLKPRGGTLLKRDPRDGTTTTLTVTITSMNLNVPVPVAYVEDDS
jgi:hypothetical protein